MEKNVGGDNLLSLDTFIPYRINVLATKISESLAVEYRRDFGISIAEWRVLAILGQYSPLAAKQLASEVNLGKVRLSRTTTKLYEDGLIMRSISAGDRRKTFFRLSTKGKRLYEKIVPLAIKWQDSLMESFSDKDTEQLVKMIDLLEARLEGKS
ncbi:MAG: MarR family winged helix-turn-helix transcriptional regulator [Arenicella sp.]